MLLPMLQSLLCGIVYLNHVKCISGHFNNPLFAIVCVCMYVWVGVCAVYACMSVLCVCVCPMTTLLILGI